MLGSKEKQGFLKPFCIYALLICVGFIYLNPILHMISTGFMTLDDLLDSSINWIPSSPTVANYLQAAKSMDFWASSPRNPARKSCTPSTMARMAR